MAVASLTKARLLVSLGILSSLVGSTAPSPLYGIYQARFHFSSTTLTSLFAVYAMGVLFALATLGKLSDRLDDRRFILVPALGIVAVGSLIFAFSTDLSSLFIGRFFAGVGTGALTGSANAALVGFDAKDGKSHAPVFATVSFTLGAALGPVLSTLAVGFELQPTITPFLFNALLATLISIGLCRVAWVPPDIQQADAGDQGPVKPTLRQQMQGRWGAFARISGLLIIAWSVGSVFVALGPSMVISTLASPSSKHAAAGLLVTGFQTSAGITQFLLRSIVPKTAMTVGCGLIFVSWLGCLAGLYLHQPEVFVIFSVLAGVGYGASFVGVMGVFTQLAPAENRAALGSLFYLAGYLGSAVAIIAMGGAIDAFGLFTASGLMLLVLGLALGGVSGGRLPSLRPQSRQV